MALAAVLGRLPAGIRRSGPPRGGGGFGALRPYAKPLTLLYLIVVLRTVTALSFSTFVPVMLTRRGMSLAGAGAVSAIFLVSSSLGGFFGGGLADRWGAQARHRRVARRVRAVLRGRAVLHGWPLVASLAIGGLLLQSTLPVNVTFGQRIAPISAATVSSLMMGFAWGTGGLCVPLVGMLADRIGIEGALSSHGVHAAGGGAAGPAAARGEAQAVVAHVGPNATD